MCKALGRFDTFKTHSIFILTLWSGCHFVACFMMRKVRHREVEYLPRGHRGEGWLVESTASAKAGVQSQETVGMTWFFFFLRREGLNKTDV